ncbi:MAG: hypothetical protein Q8Q36_01750 [bacterium]|nr:hypothetical protein [bacterium]
MKKECKHEWLPLLGRHGRKSIPTRVFSCFHCGEMKVGAHTIKMSQYRMDMGELPMKNVGTIGLIAAPTADLTATGFITSLTTPADLVFGDICYINGSSQAVLARADVIATSSAIVMAIATIDGSPTPTAGNFLMHGFARKDAWTWTPGGLIYLSSATAGLITQTAPVGTDNVIQILGVATHADRVYFNPSLVQVEHT